MTTAAQQYRALVAKLEAINPSQLNELKIGDIDPATGQRITGGLTDSEGNLVGSGTPGVNWNQTSEPVAAPTTPDAVAEPTPVQGPGDTTATPLDTLAPETSCGPEVQAKIKEQPTFNKAYAMAKQSGCPEFDWCQIVNVGGQGATPADNWFNAPGMGTGSVVTPNGKPTFATPVKESEQLIQSSEELDRFREIAGTQVIEAAGGIPEIKASSKEAAIAIAQKKGLKQFRFCGKYKVQAAKQGATPTQAPAQVPSAAAVGNPNISRSTAPGNPNIRPGSLRDRAAQANAARRPGEPRF